MTKTIMYGEIEKITYEYNIGEIIQFLKEKDKIYSTNYHIETEWKYDESEEVCGLEIIQRKYKMNGKENER